MTKQVTKILTIVVFVIFLFSIGYFIGNVVHSISSGKSICSNQFEYLLQEIKAEAEKNSYDSKVFTSTIKKIIDSESHISTVILYSNNEPIFAYPLTSEYLFFSSESMPQISVSSPLVKVLSNTISPLNNSNLTIEAACYTMLPGSIFSYGRLSFILILIATLSTLTGIIIIHNNSSETKNNQDDEKVEQKEIDLTQNIENENYSSGTTSNQEVDTVEEIFDVSEEQNENDSNDNHSENETEESIETNEAAESEETEEITDTMSETSYDTDTAEVESDISLSAASSDDNVNKEITDTTEDVSFSAPLSKSEDPTGLFSNKTGFGWESYFETRLDSELIRSASSEQDLAVFYIQISGLNEHSEILPAVCSALIDFFQFRDLIFEHGKDVFSIIMQNADLNSSMLLAEDLYASLTAILSKFNLESSIAIGISNRSIRLISGSRIMEEAEQALQHAKLEKEVRIVAYKVNPDKYRQYLAEENKRLQQPKTEVEEILSETNEINQIPEHV